MKINKNTDAVPGWIGGFAASKPEFAYPQPDLSSLPVLGNLDNIPKLERQQAVVWPEFSWETKQGDQSSRCYQMFAHDISRLGYDNTGRVWSIICPQQGVVFPSLIAINVEVTVTGQRGWANETNRELYADMSVEGKIWFSPGCHQNKAIQILWELFAKKDLPFPSSKANAIRVSTHKMGQPDQPLFPLRSGETTRFKIPDFARHPEAWAVGNLDVQIGPIIKTNHEAVDNFNQRVLDLFNMASGNMLQEKNILSWNVWFTAPETVDTEEWRTHAERWRESIDADHGSPEGSESSQTRFIDGKVFTPTISKLDELEDILGLVKEILFS